MLNEVEEYENIINQYANEYSLDIDLVKAIIFLETTHGWYDKAYDMPLVKDELEKIAGRQKSFLPMNVNYEYWKDWIEDMGYTREDVKNNASINIKIGCLLLKRIIDRLEEPTIEKIGSIYNVLGKEKVSQYSKYLNEYYKDKIWISSIDKIIEYIKENIPSTKDF